MPANGVLVDLGRLTPAPSGAVAVVEVGDEVVLVDDLHGRALALNPSAALVWTCLDGESSLAEICGDLSEVLGLGYEEILADVQDLVRQLLDAGLATAPGVDPAHADDGRGCCGDPVAVPDERVGAIGAAADDDRRSPEAPDP